VIEDAEPKASSKSIHRRPTQGLGFQPIGRGKQGKDGTAKKEGWIGVRRGLAEASRGQMNDILRTKGTKLGETGTQNSVDTHS